MPKRMDRNKTTVYTWEGLSKAGNKIKGESAAANIGIVKADLRKHNIEPIVVRKKSPVLFRSGSKKIKSLDITYFTRQLATMLGAGVPLLQTFELIAQGQTKDAMRTLLTTIKQEVEAGDSLAKALSKHPKYFSSLYTSLIEAGEQAGALESMLNRIANYQEKTERIKAKVKKALFYPAAVLAVAAIVTAILLIFVIPQFAQLFKSFGANLPAMTLVVISLSVFLQSYWWIILGIAILIAWAFIQARQHSPSFALAVDKAILRIPVIGSIIKNAIIARFARTLATTFAAGVPLVDALTCVSGATGNLLYANATLRIRDEISTGQRLQIGMQATQLFPNMVTQMVAIGEESGTLEVMLNKIADFHETDVDNAVDNLSSLLEPFIIVILGIVVGTLVVAMYLPIFKLGSVIRG